jgi:hypothetical protein
MPKKCETPCLKLGQEHWYYEDCSFSSKGIGTYMGNENSDPQLERFES